VMPTLAGFFALGGTWTKLGPFRLGDRWFKGLAIVSLAGVCVLIWIGVQPPNQQALTVTVGAAIVLLAAWWLGVRRFFRGPPAAILSAGPVEPPRPG